ncbi:MAG: Crp/Fnr family transcriptional regulator [Deltaproteobacteria bacterium]|nr:Crp/Fnr family transcriptional regulator [Deltaproteobacteria bacterium]
MDITKIIASIPLFNGLAEKQCASLASIAVGRTFKRGQSLFAEGDEGTGFYVILSGRVKIFKLSPEGKEQIFHILEDLEPFGEAAVFTGQHFPASAQALADTRTLFFPRSKFVELIGREPSLALSMLALMSRRLRKLTVLVENLSLKEVPGRLAAYLLYRSEDSGDSRTVKLDISKNQMAGLLGTIPETLSRILKRMTEEKLIKATTRSISILDREGLAELAEGMHRLA